MIRPIQLWPKLLFLGLVLGTFALLLARRSPMFSKLIAAPRRTVDDVVNKIGPIAEKRLHPRFVANNATYPPKQTTLVAYKKEQLLELWVKEKTRWIKIQTYPFTANSGTLGPKLREGDKQIPEGLYEIYVLNPNSRFHLSMGLNYPNAFDKEQARRDGRHNPGSEIFIHGWRASVGCIALGDRAIEELFVLVAKAGRGSVDVIISPHTLGQNGSLQNNTGKKWVDTLYKKIATALKPFAENST